MKGQFPSAAPVLGDDTWDAETQKAIAKEQPPRCPGGLEAHVAQIDFYGECAHCGALDPEIATQMATEAVAQREYGDNPALAGPAIAALAHAMQQPGWSR